MPPGAALVIVLGGPAMLIGLGGGAASSMARGSGAARTSTSRRCSAATPRCSGAPGSHRPLLGAGRRQPDPLDPRRRRRRAVERAARSWSRRRRGGASSCARSRPTSPACRRSRSGATKRRSATCWRSRPRLAASRALCERERCPFAVVGDATDDGRLRVDDRMFGEPPVDMPLEVLLGKPPEDDARRRARAATPATVRRRDIDLREARVARAAAAGRRGQDVPDHDRRPHGRRPDQPRSDGRARGRCRWPTSRSR